MDVTRGRISSIPELREMLLSFQTGFNLVNVAVICAILEKYLRLGTLVRYKGAQVLKILSFYFDLFVGAAGNVCHQLGLLGSDLYAVGCGGFVETLN